MELFDAECLRMSQGEAIFMDPQQRLLLQRGWEALTSSSVPSLVGVFVGISSMDYSKVMAYYMTDLSPYAATGSALSVAAGRVSYIYGLQGPSVSTDTACSSSLVGSHVACNSILLEECAAALTCGVNLTLSPDTGAVFKQAGMLAIDGRCKTLDADADGYVRGEACGVLLLDSALGVSDSIVCVAGSAVNQDGRSSALTAPNGPAQQKVILGALRRASLTSQSVCQLHMHGTGTPLGDPIEIGAVRAVLMHAKGGVSSSVDIPLSVQAGKTYVGHTEPAAGVVGLIHVIHGICHDLTSPVLHLRHINPHLTRILPTSALEGERLAHLGREQNGLGFGNADPQANRASGVSAFAFQGTNAHALVSHTRSLPGVLASWRGCHWRNQHLWVGPKTHPLGLFVVPVLDEDIHLSAYSQLMRPEMQWVWDHRVMGRVLFPGAGFMEAACALVGMVYQGASVGAAVHASIAAPLVLSLEPAAMEPSSQGSDIYLESKLWCLGGNIQIGSSSGLGSRKSSSTHVRCMACNVTDGASSVNASSAVAEVSMDCMRGQCERPVDWAEVYRGFAQAGLEYGPQFRTAKKVRLCGGKLAQGLVTSIPASLPGDSNETGLVVHPAAMDGCLHLAAAVHFDDEGSSMAGGAYVPAGFGAYGAFRKSDDTEMRASALSCKEVSAQSAPATSVVTDHKLHMQSGVPVAVLCGLEA
ncbi:MAG: beta-ketoacyl synthase N-terminal-like domain-containing protein, partial [Cyanobacteriota bacterium]|nr:beta-ketoacyl synthase N-terminal-like domain-containing protein [Cyanobacteriota bacterium]